MSARGSQSSSIVWFRQDLRLADNPALNLAVQRGGPVTCVYVWSPEEEGAWPLGAASRWWLHQSLSSLDRDLGALGQRLVLRVGPALEVLRSLASETGAGAVFWNRRYEPAAIERDTQLKAALRESGLIAESSNASLLVEPWQIQTAQGGPYKVFTPFWRAVASGSVVAIPSACPEQIQAGDRPAPSVSLDSLELEPKIDWAKGMRAFWIPGRAGAMERLDHFRSECVFQYDKERDRPDHEGTSLLSPHLHFGEIGPREVWHAVMDQTRPSETAESTKLAPGAGGRDPMPYLRQLVWREFAHHLLYHYPHTAERPLREDFERFPWDTDADNLRAWQRGRTGYPIVDAAMRQLWSTGWMHNRARMIAASFLVKHLLQPWNAGAKWFWDTLVDADLANNSLGWQWIAGSGADAAPYFRVFNPLLQGKKFDPDGDYVRHWIPELSRLDAEWIHAPWEAPSGALARAGVELGRTYPHPIVDHRAGRERALSAYAALRQGR